MSDFVTLLLYGLSEGAVLAMAALGFVLIYKATRVINFAQGQFLLIGAYSFFTAFVLLSLPLPLALVLALGVAVLLGLAVERFILRPMVGEEPINVIMVTVGLSALLGAVVQMFFGTSVREMPALLPRQTVTVLGGQIPLSRLLVIAIAGVVLTAFSLFFQRSRHGVAMRAVADDQQAAMTMGISVRQTFALAWALAALSAVIAGVLLADVTVVDQNIAAFGLFVFPVVILGGLDSVLGTIIGGFCIGIVRQMVGGYLDPSLAEIAPYIVLVLVLLVRPYGLFGEQRIERV